MEASGSLQLGPGPLQPQTMTPFVLGGRHLSMSSGPHIHVEEMM